MPIRPLRYALALRIIHYGVGVGLGDGLGEGEGEGAGVGLVLSFRPTLEPQEQLPVSLDC
jgi:hypothetical protein